MSAQHPEREASRGALMFARVIKPLLVLLLIVVAVPVFASATGLVEIPALDAMR